QRIMICADHVTLARRKAPNSIVGAARDIDGRAEIAAIEHARRVGPDEVAFDAISSWALDGNRAVSGAKALVIIPGPPSVNYQPTDDIVTGVKHKACTPHGL